MIRVIKSDATRPTYAERCARLAQLSEEMPKVKRPQTPVKRKSLGPREAELRRLRAEGA